MIDLSWSTWEIVFDNHWPRARHKQGSKQIICARLPDCDATEVGLILGYSASENGICGSLTDSSLRLLSCFSLMSLSIIIALT